MLSDTRYSHPLLRALLVLTAFPMDGSELALKDVTSHLALERDPASGRYRRAIALANATAANAAGGAVWEA